MEHMRLKRKSLKTAQGMIEFALTLPFLLLLIFGIIEAGRLLFIYSMVQSASREAARYGSASNDFGAAIGYYEDCAGIRAAGTRLGRLAGITNGNITITYDHGPGSGVFASCPPAASQPVKLGDRIAVQVVGNYRPLVPMVGFNTFPIVSVSRRTIIKDVSIEGTPPAPVPPIVAFTTSEQTSAEDAGPLQVLLQLSAATSKTVSVSYSISGSAAQGDDYTISPGTVVFGPGETLKGITITLLPDEIDEDDETIVLTLGSPTNAVKGTPDVHTVTLTDDDLPPTVFFSTESQTILESQDFEAVLQLSAPSSRPVTVSYSIGGTAQGAGVDYLVSSGPAVIPPGDTTFPILVDVIDDLLDEEDETVEFVITGAMNATVDNPDHHTATILDDDLPPFVFFTWKNQDASEESGEIFVQVELSAVSSKEITVPFDVAGTAENGTDYSINLTPLVIPPGQLTASISLTILPDADNSEVDETIEISLQTPTNALVGNPGTNTITITNVLFTPTVYFTSEGQAGDEQTNNQLTITARLNLPTNLPVTVPYTLSGTAVDGFDYHITPSPIVIASGAALGVINVQLVNDGMDEYDETIVVTMGTPVNAIAGTPAEHTITINDNDAVPTVYFALASQSVSEGINVPAIATVQLSVISGKAISVPFTLSGTAEAGAAKDYTITPSPLVILPGSSSAEIQITVNDDALMEPDEKIVITLGTPTEATLGTPNPHTITILDNDPTCPTPDSLPTFGAGPDRNKLSWTLQSPDPLDLINLVSVTIRWPTGTNVNVTAITFGQTIYTGNALPPFLSVTTPSPLWTGAFSTRQMIFKFNINPQRVSGDSYMVTATFKDCPPISGIIPSD
jgi:Flp pilus assembly protein TadG